MLQPALNKGADPRSQPWGFTLVEMIVTIAILAIAALAISNTLTFALTHQADSMPRAKVVALAQTYFDEMMAKRYDENTPSGGIPACSLSTTPCSSAANFNDGETRSGFDDVDDFDGLDDLPPRFVDGTPIPNYPGFRVGVSVRYPTAAETTALGLGTSADAKIIDLTVTTPAGSAQEFSLVRANF